MLTNWTPNLKKTETLLRVSYTRSLSTPIHNFLCSTTYLPSTIIETTKVNTGWGFTCVCLPFDPSVVCKIVKKGEEKSERIVGLLFEKVYGSWTLSSVVSLRSEWKNMSRVLGVISLQPPTFRPSPKVWGIYSTRSKVVSLIPRFVFSDSNKWLCMGEGIVGHGFLGADSESFSYKICPRNF